MPLRTSGRHTVLHAFAIAAMIAAVVPPRPANAEVVLLVNEAIGHVAEIHAAGHAAVYLSNVCSDDALTVRVCGVGEPGGVVVSTYPDFVLESPPYWVAVPLNVFLFGSESAADAPIYGSPSIREALSAQIAARELKTLLGPADVDHLPDGEWPSVIGNVLLRNVYAFHLKSTREQDAQAVAVLTDVQHRRTFDISYNNCSDFARLILNTYFPGAVHRDALNDFTITTPKAIARTLTGYAKKHPDLEFEVTRYRQTEGSIGRSQPNRNLTEKILTSKKYLAASLLISPYGLAALGGFYLATARFSVEGTLAQSRRSAEGSSIAASRLSPESRAARASLAGITVVGSTLTRRQFQQAFDRKAAEAIDRGLFPNRKAMKNFSQDLDALGAAEYDEGGNLRLRVRAGDETMFVGLTRTSVLAPDSDPQLAYKLMLSVIASELDAGGEHRPTLEELGEDWRLLDALHDRPQAMDSGRAAPIACARDGRCEPPHRSPFLVRLLKFITH